MSTKPKSRWESSDPADPADDADAATRRAEKEARRAAKAAKAAAKAASASTSTPTTTTTTATATSPPTKRRRIDEDEAAADPNAPLKLLRYAAPELAPCAHVDKYEALNRIEEGSYGVVTRAKDRATGEVVALKRLKLERETDGFPITSLREITTLLASRHPNVVNIREIVMGDTLKEWVSSPSLSLLLLYSAISWMPLLERF
jgi:cell division cycle 2-like protein